MGKTNERRTSMSGEEAGGLKTCPRCGAKLFADMDVCYGCLYDFATEHERPVDWEGSWQRRRGHVRVRIAPSS